MDFDTVQVDPFASLDRELTPMQKQLAKERARKESLATLTQIAEDMRKNGANEQSIHTAIKEVDEYLQSFKRVQHPKPSSSQPANPESKPALSHQAAGV